jgi:hypothetical protein
MECRVLKRWFLSYASTLLFAWGGIVAFEVVTNGLNSSLVPRLVGAWLVWLIITLTVVVAAALNLWRILQTQHTCQGLDVKKGNST